MLINRQAHATGKGNGNKLAQRPSELAAALANAHRQSRGPRDVRQRGSC